MDIHNLSIDEKIGQRFIFGVNSSNINEIIELIKNAYIGGVILYKRNYKNYHDMLEVIKRLKKANQNNKISLFIAIDEEGGRVNRLPNEIHNVKNIYDVSKKDYDLVRDHAKIINHILSLSGINMNLAPVVDIYNNSKSKVLEKRCIYGNKEDVVNGANKWLEAAKKEGIISIIKHYPGHGATKLDSHLFIPYVFDYRSILNKHIYPFNELINNKCDALMVGHIIVRKLTGLVPATMNGKFINKYLREKGYNGLIISDEVNMLKRHLGYRFTYLNKILRSPSDIVLVKIKDYSEGYKIINKYKQILITSKENLDVLDEHVLRIVGIKEKYKVNDDISFRGIDVSKTNDEIDLFNSKI